MFIPKIGDTLYTLNDSPEVSLKNLFDFKYDAKTLYACYEIKKENKYAYILKVSGERTDNKFWNADGFGRLLQDFIKKIPNYHENDKLVLAIHWGGENYYEGAQKLCNTRMEELSDEVKEKIILTHYSRKYDKETIGSIRSVNDIDSVIEMIKNRVDNEVHIASAQIFYDFKEHVLHRLFPLTWDQTLKNDQIKEIRKNVQEELKKKDKELKSKNTEIGDDILQPISDKISALFKSLEEPEFPDSEKCTKALQDIRANINTLIDGQLKKANKKAIYEQR